MTDAELDEINEKVGDKLLHNCKCLEPAEGKKCICLPDYSRSIAAAWEIVDSLKAQDYYIALFDENHGYGVSEKQWIAELRDHKARTITEGEAETAPLAICLAFLKLP